MASMYTDTYGFGSTRMAIPPDTTVSVLPRTFQNGGMFKYISGGSLSIVNAVGATAAQGYPLGSEVVSYQGPAKFFLAAGGATSVVGIVYSFTSGYSSFP